MTLQYKLKTITAGSNVVLMTHTCGCLGLLRRREARESSHPPARDPATASAAKSVADLNDVVYRLIRKRATANALTVIGDAGSLVALHDKDDRLHRAARAFFEETDEVLSRLTVTLRSSSRWHC